MQNTPNKKICSSCGKKGGIFDFDYSGYKFDVNSNYCFPHRIKLPDIPSLGPKYYLCDACASKNYKVGCKIHGYLKDSYEYGQPPKCKKCEKELLSIRNGSLPNSFLAIVPITKLVVDDKFGDTGIWLGLTRDNYIYVIRKKYISGESVKNINFYLSETLRKSVLVAAPKISYSFKNFEIDLLDDKVRTEGKGPWIDLWRKAISDGLSINSNSNFYFSNIEIHRLQKNKLELSTQESGFVFWSIFNGKIHAYTKSFRAPSIENLKNWAISDSQSTCELKLMFNENNVPIILTMHENVAFKSIESIKNIELPHLLKTDPKNIKIKNETGIFKFILNNSELQEMIINRVGSNVDCTWIKNGESFNYSYGYCYNNYLLLINTFDKTFAVSEKNQNEFKLLSNYIEKPIFKRQGDLCHTIYCFNTQKRNTIIKIDFWKEGFVINDKQKIKFCNIKNIHINNKKDHSELLIDHDYNGNFQTIFLAGEKEYINDIWKYLENKKISFETAEFDTNQLYRKYNQLKKKNWLIGLLSNIILLYKELDEDMATNELHKKLNLMDHNEFYEDKYLYKITIKKLYTFIQMIPDIKRNLELMNTYFPHLQFKDEYNFISEAFGEDVAEKIKDQEYENVIKSSRGSMGLLQLKLNRVLSEIERSIAPVENLFAKEEIQKEFISKASKYSALGGQAALVGTLIAVGGVTGGIGILAGMLGIRGMSDYMNILNKNRESAFIIKQSADKVISWWSIFKKTFPVTIYELEKELDKEYIRCVKRDKFLFKRLNESKKLSIDEVNKALGRRIQETNKVRFNEIIKGTGILFNDISFEIEKTKCLEIGCPDGVNNIIQL